MRPLPRFNRAHLARFGVVIWLVLLSAVLTSLSIALSRLETQEPPGLPDQQMAELQGRLGRLEAFQRNLEAAPANVLASDFQQAREQWQQQWHTLEQRLQDRARAADLEPLQARLDTLAEQIATLKLTHPPVPARPSPPRTALRSPGFKPLGVESRGGERFLAIQPNETHGLGQVRLLRIGDTQGRWQLQALEEQHAVFSVARKTRRLTLPEE